LIKFGTKKTEGTLSFGKLILAVCVLVVFWYCTYRILSRNIYPLEFDTVVFVDLVLFFQSTGNPWTPVFLNDTGIVCAPSGCNSFNGSVYQTNFLTPDYTSGLGLLYGTAATVALFDLFSIDSHPKGAVINAYAFFVTGITVLSVASIAWLSRLSFINFTIFILGVFLSVLFLIPFAADRIVGEFLSSLLLVTSASGLYFLTIDKQAKAGLMVVALILGLAVETKMSSLFTASFLLGVVYLTAWKLEEKWGVLVLCTLAVIFPKTLFLFVTWFYLGFNLEAISLFVEGMNNVASYNAAAGLNWNIDRFTSRWNMLAQHDYVIWPSAIFLISIGLQIAWKFNQRHQTNVTKPLIALALMAVSLLFPIIYKFPYPRLLAQFVALIPLLLLSGLGSLATGHLRTLFIVSAALIMIFLTAQQPIQKNALFTKTAAYERIESHTKEMEYISKAIMRPDTLILVNGFFGMPWDLLYEIEDKQKHEIRFQSIYAPARIASNVIHLQSCRYGHCDKGNALKISLKSSPPRELACVLTNSTEFYRLRTCTASQSY